MARYNFNLPDIGEGIAEAEIVEWHVEKGDKVEEDQPIAAMMTDKATIDLESPVAGTIIERMGEVGDTLAIGSLLVAIDAEGDVDDEDTSESAEPASEPAAEPEAPATEPEPVAQEKPEPAPETKPAPVEEKAAAKAKESEAPKSSAKVLASPAVRKRAQELAIDLADVAGEGDRVRHGDLDAYLSENGGFGASKPRRADEEVKVIGMRRKIAENMAASKANIPHFSYVEEIDVTELEEMRAQLNANRGDKPKLTLLPFMISAICKTVPQFPMINARYDDEAGVVTRHGAVHLGMATQTDAGLMVPVIRDAQAKNVWQLAKEIVRLSDAARNGKATKDELTGSTLTITSLGPLGGIATTPVINRPEVAIIGPNRIIERPMFVGDDIEARKLMNLSISCDHRVVDGWDAASFVQALRKLLETPVLMFAPD